MLQKEADLKKAIAALDDGAGGDTHAPPEGKEPSAVDAGKLAQELQVGSEYNRIDRRHILFLRFVFVIETIDYMVVASLCQAQLSNVLSRTPGLLSTLSSCDQKHTEQDTRLAVSLLLSSHHSMQVVFRARAYGISLH